MAHRYHTLLLCLGLAAAFTLLFHDTGIGLNLLLFEALAALAWKLAGRRVRWSPLARVSLGAVAATAVAIVLHASAMAIALNIISVALAVGLLLAPELSATHHAFLLAVQHAWKVPAVFARMLPRRGIDGAGARVAPRLIITTASMPLLLALFAGLYGASNPYFGALVDRFYAWVGQADLSLLLTLVLGLFFSLFLLLASAHPRLLAWAGLRSDALTPTPPSADRGEMRLGLVLFSALNALLLLMNVLDLQHVWLHFTFTGQYLKEFVHQGTWMLIVSIVLGAALVLYFFRGDINFIRGNAPLKWLALAWLAQNAMLAASVGMRTYHYVHHYGLAYKRIGVVIFLLATLIGLWIVMRKTMHRRSAHYLARWSVLGAFVVVVLASLIDWDLVIARYNLAHRTTTFVELGYLAFLDEKTLPLVQLSESEIRSIDAHNAGVLGEERYSRYPYMAPDQYALAVSRRTAEFKADYPQRSWREWNLADARAFAELTASERQ